MEDYCVSEWDSDKAKLGDDAAAEEVFNRKDSNKHE